MKEQNVAASNDNNNGELIMLQRFSPETNLSSRSASPTANETPQPTSTTKLLSQQESFHHTKDIKPSKLDFAPTDLELVSSPDPTNEKSKGVELSKALTTEKSEAPPSESADDVDYSVS